MYLVSIGQTKNLCKLCYCHLCDSYITYAKKLREIMKNEILFMVNAAIEKNFNRLLIWICGKKCWKIFSFLQFVL